MANQAQNEKIIETRLGRQLISMEKALRFPHGLIGFEDQREFILLQIKENSPFLILQSLNEPKIGLLVADPYTFTTDYSIKIGESEQKILRLKNIEQVSIMVTVAIPPGQPEKTVLNLAGPILINHHVRIGLQVPQVEADFPQHLLLSDLEKH